MPWSSRPQLGTAPAATPPVPRSRILALYRDVPHVLCMYRCGRLSAARQRETAVASRHIVAQLPALARSVRLRLLTAVPAMPFCTPQPVSELSVCLLRRTNPHFLFPPQVHL